MKPKEELYSIRIKGEQRGDVTIMDVIYTIGGISPQYSGIPQKITMGFGKVYIYFEDGSKMVTGYDPLKIDLFYKPIKEEDGGTDNNSYNTTGT